MLPKLAEKLRILDIGCGPGMQTIQLSKISAGTIDAVDTHHPFLDYLRQATAMQRLGGRIRIVQSDMHALPYPIASFDIVWSEGAVFIIGFEKGLRYWRNFLIKNGYAVLSELSWIALNPPEQVKKYMTAVYPSIKTIEENLIIARNAGYGVLGFFILPEKSWWENYYIPIEKKIPFLKLKYKDDKEALSMLDSEEFEIDMFRRYSGYYGYVFYILQRIDR